jgi:hypothetical protein
MGHFLLARSGSPSGLLACGAQHAGSAAHGEGCGGRARKDHDHLLAPPGVATTYPSPPHPLPPRLPPHKGNVFPLRAGGERGRGLSRGIPASPQGDGERTLLSPPPLGGKAPCPRQPPHYVLGSPLVTGERSALSLPVVPVPPPPLSYPQRGREASRRDRGGKEVPFQEGTGGFPFPLWPPMLWGGKAGGSARPLRGSEKFLWGEPPPLFTPIYAAAPHYPHPLPGGHGMWGNGGEARPIPFPLWPPHVMGGGKREEVPPPSFPVAPWRAREIPPPFSGVRDGGRERGRSGSASPGVLPCRKEGHFSCSATEGGDAAPPRWHYLGAEDTLRVQGVHGWYQSVP